DDAGADLPDQVGGGAVRGDDGEDRALGGNVLEDLAGEHAPSTPAGLGDQEQQRVRGSLQLERTTVRGVGDQLEPVAEAERLRPLAVGDAEVADEPRDDVAAGLGERLEERPRAALPEEAPGVRDREPLAAAVGEAEEVVEV